VANSRAQETGDLAVTIPERGGATCPSSEHVAICSKDLFGASFGAKRMNRTEYTAMTWIAVLWNEQDGSSAMLHTQEVTGSSPVAPTIRISEIRRSGLTASLSSMGSAVLNNNRILVLRGEPYQKPYQNPMRALDSSEQLCVADCGVTPAPRRLAELASPAAAAKLYTPIQPATRMRPPVPVPLEAIQAVPTIPRTAWQLFGTI
jgi:hypothetical protein